MPRFVVEGNVTFTVDVEVEVEADDAEEAKEKALRAGLLEEAAAAGQRASIQAALRGACRLWLEEKQR